MELSSSPDLLREQLLDRATRVRRRAELLFDAEQLVVLRDAVGAARRAGLDLARAVPTARSAIVVSSVSPERCEMTLV